MLGFILGLFAGATVGLVISALISINKEELKYEKSEEY